MKNIITGTFLILVFVSKTVIAQETFNGSVNIIVSNEITGALNVGDTTNVNNGNYTFTLGNGVETSGWGSVAMGYLSKTSGDMSITMGYDSEATGYNSFSFGTYTKALHDYSQAFGKSSKAIGQVSTAFGEGSQSEAQFSMAIGRWNVGGGSAESWVGTDPLFEVGNGSNNTNRSNALTIFKNGESTFFNNMKVEGTGFFTESLTIGDEPLPNGFALPEALLQINNGDNSYGTILANASESNFSLYTKTLTTQPTNIESFRIGLKYLDDEQNGYISFYRGTSTSGGFLGFSTNGIERIRILPNGNVGIGTNDPKNELSVHGTVWAKEVKVSLTDAADWVFEDDYRLASLEEVESYIKSHKHLPNVPSAEEFRKNDLNVAEMDNLLLQKLEELTLYMIDLNRQVQSQQSEIEILKAKNALLKGE